VNPVEGQSDELRAGPDSVKPIAATPISKEGELSREGPCITMNVGGMEFVPACGAGLDHDLPASHRTRGFQRRAAVDLAGKLEVEDVRDQGNDVDDLDVSVRNLGCGAVGQLHEERHPQDLG
jgi:hypothetical protein